MRRPATVPGRVAQLRDGIGALLTVLLIAALPVVLLWASGNPLPVVARHVRRATHDPGAAARVAWQALTSRDDGELFLSALTLVGWTAAVLACWAWLSFLTAFAAEFTVQWRGLRHRRVPANVRPLPGMRLQQRAAAALAAAVIGLLATPALAAAAAAPTAGPAAVLAAPRPVTGATPTAPFDATPTAPFDAAPGEHPTLARPVHLVQRGESLLDIAERHRLPWQRLAEANYGRPQPDGRSLSPGSTRVYAGWSLLIPVDGATATLAAQADGAGAGLLQALNQPTPLADSGAVDHPDPRAAPVPGHAIPRGRQHTTFMTMVGDSGTTVPAPATYRVARGDWLSAIATRFLGDPTRYTEIAALNPALQRRDPRFPDHIEATWKVRLPSDARDRGARPHATGSLVHLGQDTDAEPTPRPGTDLPSGGAGSGAPANSAPPAAIPTGSPYPDPSAPGAPPSTGPDPTTAPTTTAQPPASAQSTLSTGPAPVTAPGTAGHPGGPLAPGSPPPAPTGSTEPDQRGSQTGDSAGPDSGAEHDDRLVIGALAGAGLLCALVLTRVVRQRRRQHQYRRPGRRLPHPRNGAIERDLRANELPAEVDRLDLALHSLAGALADRPRTALPDIAAVWIADQAIILVLAARCPDPPAPWIADNTQWILPGNATPPSPAPEQLSALPALATVASRPGGHLLLDLERAGHLTVEGEPERCKDLLRYLVSELSVNAWSDEVEIIIAGFSEAESALLSALDPTRITVARSITDVAHRLERRVGAVTTALNGRGGGTLASRISDHDEAWAPQILVVGHATEAEHAVLASLGDQIRDAGHRCAVAIVALRPAAALAAPSRITIAGNSTLHLTMPHLNVSECDTDEFIDGPDASTGGAPAPGASDPGRPIRGAAPTGPHSAVARAGRALAGELTAAGLPARELEPLAEILRAARVEEDVPAPPAHEPEPWDTGTDADGAPPTSPDGTWRQHLGSVDVPAHEPDAPRDTATVEPILAVPGDLTTGLDSTEPTSGSPRLDREPDPVTATTPAPVAPAAGRQEPRPDAVCPPGPATPATHSAGTQLRHAPADTATDRSTTTAPLPGARRRTDPSLDHDLTAWYEPDPTRPRIGILGPVTVDSPGPVPDHRRRFHAEIIVYLAQRNRGVTGEQLTEALWPLHSIKDTSRRVAVTRARRWLGDTPTGEPWLPEMGPDRIYRLRPGYLLDWHLFQRLRSRGEAAGPAGANDLHTALALVRGAPLEGADRAYAAGTRTPYTWLPESNIFPDHLASAIVDTAHRLAELHLDAGDTGTARWAVQQGWLAEPYRSDDMLWLDLIRAARLDGRRAELRTLLHDLIRCREAEVPEDLNPTTYAQLCRLLPDLIGATTGT